VFIPPTNFSAKSKRLLTEFWVLGVPLLTLQALLSHREEERSCITLRPSFYVTKRERERGGGSDSVFVCVGVLERERERRGRERD
jgi:hypothetical protein